MLKSNRLQEVDNDVDDYDDNDDDDDSNDNDNDGDDGRWSPGTWWKCGTCFYSPRSSLKFSVLFSVICIIEAQLCQDSQMRNSSLLILMQQRI